MLINRVYNGDCVEIMKNIPPKKINAVITSPPYNTMRHTDDQGYDEYKDGINNNNYAEWIVSIFDEFNRILATNGVVLWNMSYGSENTECMSLTVAEIIKKSNFTLADILVWKKPTATPNNVSPNKMTRICEYVYVFCRKTEFLTFETNKKEISKSDSGQSIYENIYNFFEAQNNDEPTPLNKATFSTAFVDKLIKMYVKAHSLVLDCFMGTGTTAIACMNKNINFIGCELSPAQCDYANTRIKKRMQNWTLFDEIDYSAEREI